MWLTIKTFSMLALTMYMRMSLIITMAVWWSVQAIFSTSRKLPCRDSITCVLIWHRRKKNSVVICDRVYPRTTHLKVHYISILMPHIALAKYVSYSTDNRDEPHTGRNCIVHMGVCLFAYCIDWQFWMSRFKHFMKVECPTCTIDIS